MKKIKLFEGFAGYGGASFGLQKAKIPYEVVGFSEIDKHAIKFYSIMVTRKFLAISHKLMLMKFLI